MKDAVGRWLAAAAWLGALCGCSADSDVGRQREGVASIAGAGGTAGASPIAGGAGVAGSPPPLVGGVPVDPSSGADGECGAVEQQAMVALQPADIIWAIDNSGSMTEEALAVQQNMNAFASRLAGSGIDVHLVMVSTTAPSGMGWLGGGGGTGTAGGGWASFGGGMTGNWQQECQGDNGVCIDAPFGSGTCPEDSKAPNFLHLLECVNSWNALNKIVSTYPLWKDMLRPNATKHFVVVTDDDSLNGNYTADQFIDAVNALDPATIGPDWKAHGIYCFSDCPSASNPGVVYQDLIAKRGGVAGDMCLQDFEPVFDELATTVIQGSSIACDWPVPAPPEGETLDTDKVNVRFTPSQGAAVDILRVPPGTDCGPTGGWQFDDDSAPTTVKTCPATCDSLQADPGGKVSVLFGCESKLVPVD